MDKEVAKRIRQTFEKNIKSLDITKQRHFFTRLYRVTKDERYKKQIAKLILKEKEEILDDLNKADDKNHIKTRSQVLFDKLLIRKKEKYFQRQKVFFDKKEYLFYYQIIDHLYLLKYLGLSKNIFYKKGINFLKNSNHENYLLDETLIEHYGTQMINYIYYLKSLRIVDLRKKFETKFKRIFMKENLSDYMYRHKIYGLAHFIIAGSDYYQKHVSLKEFGWVIKYFKQNIEEILERTNTDIIAEVGLCFKLCKIKTGKETKIITEYILKAYDKSKGYIPRLTGDLNDSEHANIVAYLFLCDFKKLYKGPDISSTITFKNTRD